MTFIGPIAYLVATVAMIAAGLSARRDPAARGTAKSRLWFVAAILFLIAAGFTLGAQLTRS